MTKIWKIANLIVLGLLLLLCGLGTFYKHISFGLGLGDVLGYLVLYAGTLIHLILTFSIRKKESIAHSVLALAFSIFTVLVTLNATIWRGPEYRWNGSIFYLPCPTNIKVQNQDIERDLLIQMCSMEYYSEFTGTWDGKYMTINEGEIKVPEEFDQYITRPIAKVEIEPDGYGTFNNNTVDVVFNFNPDTLMTSERYKITGEISAIRNAKPVMKVKIK